MPDSPTPTPHTGAVRGPLTEAPARFPLPVALVALLAAAYILAPVLALGTRVPWRNLGSLLRTPETADLVRITLSSGLIATAVSTVLGTCLALWLQQLRGSAPLARALVYLPLAMPPVVGGLALTALLGRQGLLSPLLAATGIQLAFAFSGVVAAHTFVTMPFVVVAVDSALRHLDPEVHASARAVGISPWRILSRITTPAIAPAVLSGAALALARSLGEFGTTITFAGSMPGVTRTMPSGIYLAREVSADHAYALSALLIGLALVALIIAAAPGLWAWTRAHRSTQTPKHTEAMDVAALRDLTAADNATLDDVLLDTPSHHVRFPGGATTAVIGPNGSGKTTLMSFLGGRFSGATVRGGHGEADHADATARTSHRAQIVMLTQRPGLPPTATVRQALTMVTGNASRTEELLRAAGLSGLGHVRELSGGQAAQVALLRALAARPQVLVLDEPFAAMDVAAAARWRYFLSTASGTRTLVLVTHRLEDVTALASELLVMDNAQVRAQGPARALLAQPPTAFVAELQGVNFLEGSVDGEFFSCGGLRVPLSSIEHASLTPGYSGPVCATCSDEDVVVVPEARDAATTGAPGKTTAETTVVALTHEGGKDVLILELAGQRLRAAAPAGHPAGGPGSLVRVAVSNLRVYPKMY